MHVTDHSSDTDLLTACRKGNLHAFERLVHRYQQVLYFDVQGYTREPDLAQDIVQETFVSAFRSLDRIQSPERFGTWLRRTAKNRYLTYLRSRRRASASLERLQNSGSCVEEQDDNPSSYPAVRVLLENMPLFNTRIALMHYVDNRSISFIAEQLGLSASAVKQRLYRIRHHIQKEVLTMMKDDINKNQLPAGIPGRVIARLVEEGRDLWLHMRYDQAQARLREAIDLAPDDPFVLLAFGDSYDPVAGIDSEQIEVLERAAKQVPQALAVLCALTSAYWQTGDKKLYKKTYKQAINQCDNRLQINPKDMDAIRCKAELMRMEEDFKGAEAVLRKGLAEAPEDQFFNYHLGFNMDRQGRHEEALVYYEKTRAVSEQTVWAYCALRQQATHYAFREDNGERAITFMKKVWALTKRPHEGGNLVYFYSMTGAFDKAAEVYDTIKGGTSHTRAAFVAGLGRLSQKNYKAARSLFQKVIEGKSDQALKQEAALHMAAALYNLKKEESAREALENGLELDLENRSPAAGRASDSFRRHWTTRLAETLEGLKERDERIVSMCETVRRQLING